MIAQSQLGPNTVTPEMKRPGRRREGTIDPRVKMRREMDWEITIHYSSRSPADIQIDFGSSDSAGIFGRI